MSDSSGGWRRRATALPFRTPWFRVRRDEITLPDASEIIFHTVEHDGWAALLPITPTGLAVMERVYRWPQRAWMLECPAGGLDGEPPELAARRELEEETGYRVQQTIALGSFATSSGYTTERCHLFLGSGAEPHCDPRREASEQIEIELIDFAGLHARALAGEIEDGPTTLAVLLAAPHLS